MLQVSGNTIAYPHQRTLGIKWAITFSSTCVEFPEQGVKVYFAQFLEAFVQILLFAEVSQSFHSTMGGLVSRFQAFVG